MEGLCEGGNEPPGSLKAIRKFKIELRPRSKFWSRPAIQFRQLDPAKDSARKNGQFAKLIKDKIKINSLVFSVEECLVTVKEPIVDSEENERNRKIFKEKINNIVSKGEVSDTNVVSVCESFVNVSNSAKISGKQAVTSTEEETGVTQTGIQQAQQNKTPMQSNGNSGHQMGAVPKRVKELRSKSRLTRSRVTQVGDSSGSNDEGRGENKQYAICYILVMFNDLDHCDSDLGTSWSDVIPEEASGELRKTKPSMCPLNIPQVCIGRFRSSAK
ncbi:hypothetical protein ANN_20618 [Periplaneta americana]|uniref:Uncharacterized protein n=1 Tax=Periplaneta americana TaxID=6978 RepID=A0ABQ8SDS4_PERAM|nr:hypothetical protein ANN_20618 [Periplaneta americana]